ncbi:unnamed protein product [Clonostachys byssicola]|uniref:FAD dependent oxidoreductase domain-containing protein n=1 Tax=Clonostachys byssicola TaxID=160290 RepID=A0A9N9UL66_9HYPO|nr:unnamed protein product [Clonostachys byssicola]
MYDKLFDDPSLPVGKPTKSYWQNPPHHGLLGIKSKDLPKVRDVVIIGSGITGCSVARHLLTGGYKGFLTVLEAREVCSGATGRNGGRINAVAVLDYDKYSRLFGSKAAAEIIRFELSHLGELLDAAKSLGNEAYKKSEIREVETVAAVFSDDKLQDLKEQLAKFEAALPDLAGCWKVVESEVCEVYGMRNACGALIGKAGAVWGYRLITEIFTSLSNKYQDRLTIETQTPALAISPSGTGNEPYSIKTPRGIIRAKHVIHCTEGHISHLLPNLRGILVPRRGQITVLNPGVNFEDSKGSRSWSFYHKIGFDYLSQNEHTGELFVGGGEVGGFEGALDVHGIASDAAENMTAKSHLAGVMPVVFGNERWGPEQPQKPTLKASWTGVMCNSLDKVPMVGLLPQEALGIRSAGDEEKGAEWLSAGYGGYGMVNAWMCGKAVAEQLIHQKRPSWLPKEYVLTSERMVHLRKRLFDIKGSAEHLRALL